jgi:hypothetical protein
VDENAMQVIERKHANMIAVQIKVYLDWQK